MDDSDRTLSDLVGLLKSWVPWRSEPAHVSRDFWMPDQSCTVCYECDSQFTLFNRRHHCRLCGRIFCGKCTSNWVKPAPSSPEEEWDKIRVCNYCFKQWQQGLSAPVVENEVQDAHLDLSSSSSPSANSFISSTKSSGTCDSSNNTFISLPPSAGLTPYQSAVMDPSIHHDVDIGERNLSQNQFGFCPNRSDDEDEEYGVSHLSSTTSSFSHVNGYFSHVPFDDIDNDYKSHKVHPDGEAIDSKSTNTSSPQNSFDSHTPGEVEQLVQKGAEHDISDECEAEIEAPSSIYAAEDVDDEPVDFENNGLLWLPPEPEDEEDEKETLLFEDDDDEDAIGEWGSLRNSSSFGSGEFRNREKSNDEHKRVMKNVVDGHFRALVAQLLQVDNIPAGEENDKEGWLEIITALSWEAATILKPDMSTGGQMDPGGYVKVKCLASGRKSESLVVKGVVCKKNVAHRRMTSKIEKPRLMILGGALEYQRISNALSSFDTLLQQEMDHLKMAVAKIDSHHPDILLVEKSVSRYAQEYLLAKDISLVLNIKRPLLERIARCTGAQIVPSIDHLSSQKLGYCDMFHVEKFSEEHGTAGQPGKKLLKTLMYFEGCPKPLGCTILLRGANGDELKKVKHVVQYGVFAAYHLALETSFLADEGASLPELPLDSLITVTLPDKSSKFERSISTIPGLTVPNNEKTPGPQSIDEPQRANTLHTTDLIKEAIASIQDDVYAVTSNLSAPTSSVEGFRYSSLGELSPCPESEEGSNVDSEAKTIQAGDPDISNEMIYSVEESPSDSTVKNIQNDSYEIDSNRNDTTPLSLQLDGLEKQPAAEKEDFPPSPSDHQSILVSLSSRCVWKGTVCERSHLFRFKYYGNFDKPLGRFLRDHLFDQNYKCRSCGMPTEAHIQCYTHRQGSLTISVKRLPEILLPGEKDGKIWMWHRCLKCPRVNGFPPATQRVIMSDAAWGLSFGKFLELSFSNHAAASRVASCGHSLHRDCLRFYGFGEMVACFRYASIDVHSVYLPPPQLDFSYENQEFIEREMNEVAGRAEFMFSEVLNALRLLVERKAESGHHLADLEKMLQNEKSEFEESLHKILNKEAKEGQPAMDILELNRLRRQLVFQSYMWDHRLIYANSLDDKSQSNDIDVTSSESIQEPLAVTEKLVDTNVPIKTLDNSNSSSGDAKTDQGTDADINSDSGNQNSAIDESDSLECVQNTVSKVPSDDEARISISETLDAAWTGKNYPSSKNNVNLSESAEAERFYVEDHMEELKVSKSASSKSYDNTEDTVSWLGMSFVSFYRSLNKNFLGSAQKLDTLADYDPVYISLFRDSELQGGARLLLPVGVNDTVIPVYDDEPTSVVSYALVLPDYLVQISDEPERQKDNNAVESIFSQSLDAAHFQSFHSLDEMMLESFKSIGSGDEMTLPSATSRNSLPLDPLSYTKASHARVSFENDGPLGKVKYTVTCYYAKRFEALRRICCPSEVDFVRSLSRCRKWGAQGGKSNVFFAKTYDERFIIKQVTKTELESFIKFAPGYFKYLSESIDSGGPTCLAKILGIYQVTSKHLKGGKESKMDMLVMENLLYGRTITRLYDLKGSTRSRYNPDSSGSNKVLLDQNLIEAMPTSPIFVGSKAKRALERAVWNDTSFLASVDVMDYSLLVGVDEEKHELVVGIIDFMRQYTWDKHLETWVKASGILGGPKNAPPTIISPKQYKRRFRKAMTTYFLIVPDQWLPPAIIPSSRSQSDICEESNTQSSTPAE